MKKAGIGLGLAGIVCLMLAICLLSAGYAKENHYGRVKFMFGGGKVKLYNTKKFNAKDLAKIKLDYKSQDIIFYKGEGEEVVVKEYLRENREDAQAVMEVADGILSIRNNAPTVATIFAFYTQNEKTELYIPDAYTGTVEVHTASGNISVEDPFHFEALDTETSSGNITCEDVAAKEIQAKTRSGNIDFEAAQGRKTMSSTSGNIKVRNGEGDMEVETISGNITIDNVSGAFHASSTSGNIDVSVSEVTKNIMAETASGNIKIELPRESAFSFEAKAASGNIKTDFDDVLSFNKKGNQADGIYGKNPMGNIRTKTASGNASIRFR